jgi:hypothetical protein
MKTFREFIEEAYLIEMRKEDKVKGRTKTPLTIDRTRTYSTPGSARRAPEGSGKKWIVTPSKTETHTDKAINPTVSGGRFKQGGSGGSEYNYRRQDRPGAGAARGVKKVKGEKKPEVGHLTPAYRVASRRRNAEYLGRR